MASPLLAVPGGYYNEQMFINDQHGPIIIRQNSLNWSSSTVRWTGDSKESSCQVVLGHVPRAQVLRERERKREGEN